MLIHAVPIRHLRSGCAILSLTAERNDEIHRVYGWRKMQAFEKSLCDVTIGHGPLYDIL
jgi:hypothetical protein